MLVTGKLASCTVAATTLLAITALTPFTGAAASVGGFMHVPLLLPQGMTQVMPGTAQHAVAPVVVQPLTPMVLQAVAWEYGVRRKVSAGHETAAR